MSNVLILSGVGRYADPWHPFAKTSARLREVLEETGHTVKIADDVEVSMADLSAVDLLMANLGNPEPNGLQSRTWAAARRGFDAYLDRGAPVLALHAASASFPQLPVWEPLLGARWVPDVSMHPPFANSRVRVHRERHPIVAGFKDFALDDELYSHLRLSTDVQPLVSHMLDDEVQPLVWARTHSRSRVVVDLLGHDLSSYASPEHVELVNRSVRWLLGA